MQIPASAQVDPSFDVYKATDAYVNLLSPQQRNLSDSYFEGGYWIQLWEILWGVGACALLLATGAAERMWQWSQRGSGALRVRAPA